jgi:hypothetical protein
MGGGAALNGILVMPKVTIHLVRSRKCRMLHRWEQKDVHGAQAVVKSSGAIPGVARTWISRPPVVCSK